MFGNKHKLLKFLIWLAALEMIPKNLFYREKSKEKIVFKKVLADFSLEFLVLQMIRKLKNDLLIYKYLFFN